MTSETVAASSSDILSASPYMMLGSTFLGLAVLYVSTLHRRYIEAVVGGALIRFGTRTLLKKAQLVKREVTVKSGLTVHYYERSPTIENKDAANPPTLLILHGLTSEGKNSAKMVGLLAEELPEWRFISPDMIGHGHDLERAHTPEFDYPKPIQLLHAFEELLEALNIHKCCAFGISQGGALAYFLQQKNPELVEKSILISPAVEPLVDPKFIEEFASGQKNHVCVASKKDLRELLQNLSCPHRKVNDPVPLFLLEAVWQQRRSREPKGHFRKLLQGLIDEQGNDPEWSGCKTDIAPQCERLVIWPEDDFICSHDKGKAFFATSAKTTFKSYPDCGHFFHSSGKEITELTTPLMASYLKSHV